MYFYDLFSKVLKAHRKAEPQVFGIFDNHTRIKQWLLFLHIFSPYQHYYSNFLSYHPLGIGYKVPYLTWTREVSFFCFLSCLFYCVSHSPLPVPLWHPVFDFFKRMFLDSDFIMLLIGQPELEEFHLLLGINLVRTVFLPLLWFAFWGVCFAFSKEMG